MNTTARIENTGEAGRIHCSKEAAAFLRSSGQGHWLRDRETEVVAKPAAVVTDGRGPEAMFAVLKKQIPRFRPGDRLLPVETQHEGCFQFFRLVACLLERDGRVAANGLAGPVGAVDHDEALGAALRHPDAEP